METHYDVLKIHRGANELEIKKAYRALSLQHHPDKNPSANATKEFQKIGGAYEVLKNRETRLKYDLQLKYADAAAARTASDKARADRAAARAAFNEKERERRRDAAKAREAQSVGSSIYYLCVLPTLRHYGN